MLYYFKKGKNTIKMRKKICVVYGESTMIEHVKSGLQSVMVEISHWTVLQSIDIDSDQIEQSTLYHVGDSQHTISKSCVEIICTNAVMFITSMFGFHVS